MIRIFNEEKSDFKNIVLSQPDSGWTENGATISGDTTRLIITGNNVSSAPSAYEVQTNAIVGHKYYVRFKFKVTNALCQTVRFNYGNVNQIVMTSPVANTTYDGSAIVTATSTSNLSYLYHYYADAATANGKAMEVYGLAIVDLTAKYGAGLEPTKAYMDGIKNINALYVIDTSSGYDTIALTINDFNTNGEKVLQPMKCIEVKQDNEDWYVDVECSTSYTDVVVQDAILVVPVKGGIQPFRVRNIENDGRKMSFKARHIGFDMEDCISYYGYNSGFFGTKLRQWRISCWDSTPPIPFCFHSDDTTFKITYIKEMTLLGLVDGIRQNFGGHLVFDWWNVALEDTIGSDNGVTIAYGKNLQGAKAVEDWSEVCTHLVPYGNNNLADAYPPTVVVATGVSYDKVYARKVFFQTDDLTELAAMATAYVEKFKVPKINYTVSSDDIQEVALGDTIKVVARQFTILTNVLGYTFNVLTQRITKVEFGNFRKDVKSVFSNIQGQFSEFEKKLLTENVQMNSQVNPTWNTITPLASWSEDATFQARVRGGVLEITGILSGGTTTNGTIIGVLPTEIVGTFYKVVLQETAGGSLFSIVVNGGNISIYGVTAGAVLHINAIILP